MVRLKSLGGAGTVTGSKHLLELDCSRILVDCGLFQGQKELRLLNWQPLDLPADSIDAVILTHGHLDHCGYLPRLVREGFRGPIYATPGTIDVAKLILIDSAFLQEKDAEFANRHGFSKHRPALPLYRRVDAERAIESFRPAAMRQPTSLPGGGELFFRRAGHILGAATAEVRVEGLTIVFSGDLGRYDDAIMHDPEPVAHADFLIVESTYGDRIHPDIDPTRALGEVIDRTVKRGGTVVIPAFAVGRAQSLLYHLWQLKRSGRMDLVPVFVDSPMATDATSLLKRHHDDHRLSPDTCAQMCSIATYVRDVDASKELAASRMPKVVISASGMATGGRVLHHLKAFGGDPRNTILFSGFQAAGTRGRAMIEGQRAVKIHGDWIDIRAEVADLEMLSAHADANELRRWLSGFRAPPKETLIVHGEPAASQALQQRIHSDLGWKCSIARMGQSHDFGGSAPGQTRHPEALSWDPLTQKGAT